MLPVALVILGKLFLDLTNKDGKIFCVDPNKGMIGKGKDKINYL